MGLPGPIRPHLFPTRHRRRADSSSNILRPTIDFEDSTIKRAFVYQHDHPHDSAGTSDSSPEEVAVLMTMVEAILGEVERYRYLS